MHFANSPLLKLDLGLPSGFALESRVPEDILVNNSFVQRNIHGVSEGNGKQLLVFSDPPLIQDCLLSTFFLYLCEACWYFVTAQIDNTCNDLSRPISV